MKFKKIKTVTKPFFKIEFKDWNKNNGKDKDNIKRCENIDQKY